MSVIFNADEIFEIALNIERNGASFYRKAANICKKEKDFLYELAEQEDEHYKIFEQMRKELKGIEKEPTAFDPDNEVSLYLKAFADSKVFDLSRGPASLLKGKESFDDIIAIAMDAEKNSIALYLGLKEMVTPGRGKDKIEKIILEEMKHIRWLAERKRV